MVTGFAGGTIGFCIPFAASFLLGSSHYVLKYYQVICEVFCGIPYVVSVTGCPKTWQIILYYALLVLWMLLEEKEEAFGRGFLRCRTLRHLLLVLACILMFLPVHTPFGLKVTMLDVGQGDCSVIQANGVTMMIDSGSTSVSDVGEYRVVKWLKYHGISKLDYVFVTHADEDHVSA
ncbi:MAG: MBL fold metallo-hydrolase, partial [Eubacterium sp.]|nr:MBL fold metallo-hydrolase [Eubacterium sp.]